ncbi:MAG: heavy metal translocating P-type ATPase [Candidatus Izemoplasmatales bacterium]|nr:heavy metal translocating P-type ATPase [Candidatus Izemoplasmatales bacterium]
MKSKFDIMGMTCTACSAAVERNVKNVKGITSVNVSLLTNSMSVEYDENVITPDKIINAVKNGGYDAKVSGISKTSLEQAKISKQRMVIRLFGSLILFLLLLYVSMGAMIGFPVPKFMDSHQQPVIFGIIQMSITIGIIILNRNYFFVGIPQIWKRHPNMDSLIAIGSASAFIYGVYIIIMFAFFPDLMAGRMIDNELYFEAAGAILTLVTLGKYLEFKSKAKTGDAIARLIDLAPKNAIVFRDGNEVEVSVDSIQVGETVIIRPGMKIPVDGLITEGYSSLDEQAITGESMPVDKKPGDKVTTATINTSGSFRFQATEVGEDTTLARIIALVQEAGNSKAPIAKLADKISGIFVPIVIGIAILTFVGWLIGGAQFGFALSMAIAVLVISCPCALGLATPVAIMVATGKGAENGILIKSAESFEIAHAIDTVVLDKTGTITYGKPEVTDMITVGSITPTDLLIIAASIEHNSEHPIGQAIVRYAKKAQVQIHEVNDFFNEPGKGLKGKIDGHIYYAGNDMMMIDYKIDLSAGRDIAQSLATMGKTPIYLADEKQLVGVFGVFDSIRPTSLEAIDWFKSHKISVVMVTGDHAIVANTIRNQLGIDQVYSETMPDKKALIIAKLQNDGHRVAMIGDGINDAIALVKADVGMAIGAGTDIAIESADIILIKNDLRDAALAIELSRKTLLTIKMNLFWAFFYNAIGIPIAAGVFYTWLGLKLDPTIGSLAMSLSSISVVLNALRLKLFHKSKRRITS